MKRIIVPATSANLGPGFDSLGVALGLYLTLDIIGPSEQWKIDHNFGKEIPNDASNLVIQTLLKIAPQTSPHHLKMNSPIPMARGLGSSSSAIVAGIELAMLLNHYTWSIQEKINIANRIEGHPDNIAPAIAGGLVIAVALKQDEVLWTKEIFPKARFVAVIPNYQLLTSDSRGVLPETLTYKQAVEASGISNVFVGKLLEGDLVSAGRLMEMDVLHEPYRQVLVPELNQVRQLLSKQEGVYGTYLSGAGPSVLSLVDEAYSERIADKLKQEVSNATVKVLNIDHRGSHSVTI